MALQSSGAISLNDVNVELGNSGTASINMGSAAVRDLFGVASGAISLSDGYGKANFSAADNFNTVLYTGNGANGRGITGVGFQPDFVWLKERASNSSNWIFDAVRGATKRVSSNETAAESTYATTLQSFDTDGFTVGTDVATNENAQTYVAWNWKANGAGVTNTNGTITSTVSANAPAGFSIVSYTGNQTAGATVGHGLSKAPEMIITKSRAGSTGWLVGHNSLPNWSYGLSLNTTAATWSENPLWNSTAPDATKFTLGSDTFGNSSNTRIAYCFHSVEGYSKVGSYTGNGSSSGPTVNCGFQPRYVMIRKTAAGAWVIQDSARGSGKKLFAHSSQTEQDWGSSSVVFTSTGFTIGTSDGNVNASGGTYIYLAFA